MWRIDLRRRRQRALGGLFELDTGECAVLLETLRTWLDREVRPGRLRPGPTERALQP